MVSLVRRQPGLLAGTQEIASTRDLPRRFVARIPPQLVRGGFVTCSRGRQHGYALAAALGPITAREILGVPDGPDVLRRGMVHGTAATRPEASSTAWASLSWPSWTLRSR